MLYVHGLSKQESGQVEFLACVQRVPGGFLVKFPLFYLHFGNAFGLNPQNFSDLRPDFFVLLFS